MTAQVIGKRFCTYCGKTNMQYYTFTYGGEKRVMGECFTRGCHNIDYCDNMTVADVKQRYGNKLVPSEIKEIDLV